MDSSASVAAPSPTAAAEALQDPMMLAVYDGYLSAAQEALSSVTKLGGTPAYLSTEAQTAVAQRTTCKRCRTPMFLVAQCYCPLRDGANRMMYVFACNKARCAEYPLESWAAVTVQHGEEDPAIDDGQNDELERLEQPVDLRGGASGAFVFPAVATYVEPEPEKETIEQSELEREMQRAAESNAHNPDIDATDLEELDRNVDLRNKVVDEYYEKFRRRMARQPAQVMRYQPTGAPLFMNPERTISMRIPPCRHCGGHQCMELQIMPTAIFYLRAAQYAPEGGGDGFDFATVTVYTCAKACLASKSELVVNDEFVFVEQPPTIEEEAEAREGKMSWKSVVLGPSAPAAP
jgi:hypothetical protein